MAPFGQSWPWYGLVVVTLTAAVTEASMAMARGRSARKAEALLAGQRHELQRLMTAGPILAETRSGRRAAEIAGAERQLKGMRLALSRGRAKAPDLPVAPLPATSADAYFELAGFVERMRAQAAARGIELRPAERFGFSNYEHEGPAPELVARVHGQCQRIERLLMLLFASRPSRLLAVRREKPDSAAAHSEEDFFSRVPALSMGEPGSGDTEAFRLEFVGHTSCLRELLHALAACAPVIVVRNVSVAPLREDRSRSAVLARGARSVATLVEPAWSKFAVTVELPVPQPSEDANTQSEDAEPGAKMADAAAGLWGMPPAQSAGPDWVYDLFTPPSIWENPATRTLCARPPADRGSPELAANPEIDLDLLTVRPMAFRLQLVGCLGGDNESGLVGVFASMPSGETLLGRAGTRFPELGLRVNRITRRADSPDEEQEGQGRRRIVTADLWDEQVDEEIRVTDQPATNDAMPAGLFSSRRRPELQRELRVGDTMELDDGNYRVEQLNFNPPFAVVVRRIPGAKETAAVKLVPHDKPVGAPSVPAWEENARKGGPP